MDNNAISYKNLPLSGCCVAVRCNGDSYSSILQSDHEIALLLARGIEVWIDLSSIGESYACMAALRFCRTAKEVDGKLGMWIDVEHPCLAQLLSKKELKRHLSLVVNKQFMQALAQDQGYATIEEGKMWQAIGNVANVCFKAPEIVHYRLQEVKTIDLMQLVKIGDNGEYLDYKGLKGLCNTTVEDSKESKKALISKLGALLDDNTDAVEKDLLAKILGATREAGALHLVFEQFETLLQVLGAIDDVEIKQSITSVIDETCARNCTISKHTLSKGLRTEEQRNLCFTACKCDCDYFCLVSNTSAKGNQHYMADEEYILKRPQSLEADVVRFQNKKEKWIAFVGLIDGRPYEVFTGIQDDEEGIFCPKSVNSGKIIKALDENGQKRYDFQFINKRGFKTTIEGLSEKFNPEFWNYAKLISGVLRYGMPIEQVVKLVSSLELDNQSINNWKSGVIKALKKYLPNNESEE